MDGDDLSAGADNSSRGDRLQLVVDSMNEGFGLLAPDFTILELNNEAMRIDGRPREQVVGRNHWDAYPGTEQGEVGLLYKAAMRDRVPGSLQHRYAWTDGRISWFETRVFPTADGCLAIFYRDITEYRDALDLLARNAETFSGMVRANPFGIYIVDEDFRLAEVSLGAQSAFAGIDPLLGRDFNEVIRIIWPDDFGDEVIRSFRQTLETGEPYVSPVTVEQRRDSNVIEAYDWRIERIVLPDGRNGVACYFYDLSERNAYEERLRQAIADKDLLAREIDHRVKNSLSVVGSLLTMQKDASASPETREVLAEAADRVIAVAKIHERLHKSHLLGVVAFGAYLEELCRDLASSMRRRGVRLDVAAEPVDVPADASLPLALIANELVTNAFKHGCAAGATSVAVSLALGSDHLTLSVSDDGPGLPDESTAGSAPGPGGLGFRIVKALARQLGAVARFPAAGEGARFVVTIPASALTTVVPNR